MPKLRRLGATKMPCVRGIDHAAVERDRAGARPLEPGDGAQRRGLAAAARTEQREQLAVGHVEGHVLHGVDDGAARGRIVGMERFYAEHALPPLRFDHAEPPAEKLGQHDEAK